MMKMYNTESTRSYHGYVYRYRSLYNGSVGSWCDTQEKAEQHGEEHQKIILALHGKNTLKEVDTR